jgi:hypothetical protein
VSADTAVAPRRTPEKEVRRMIEFVDVALTDAARWRSGEEPPDFLASFTIPVEGGLADALAAAAAELPFVLPAFRRSRLFPAGVPLCGRSTVGERELQSLPTGRGVDAVWGWQVPGGTAPGVRIADVERAWELNHEQLRGSRVGAPRLVALAAGRNGHPRTLGVDPLWGGADRAPYEEVSA